MLYNLMTNRLVNSDLKDRLRGAAHLGRAGGLKQILFFIIMMGGSSLSL